MQSSKQVVAIKDMPPDYCDHLPEVRRTMLAEAGCEFDRGGPRFVLNDQVVVSFGQACDLTIEALRAAIERAKSN